MPSIRGPRQRAGWLAAPLAACALAPASLAQARHWAFVPPQKQVPAVRDAAWCRDDIDRCVLAGLEAAGLGPSTEAERALLLRRVHLVLTGLPPTPSAVATFVAAEAPQAYERVVDELLHSDACAEHLATDWLDLARFADTFGFQADFECRTWPWRDWLIAAFADDMPHDQFVRQVLAGDLLPAATTATRTATAFWRLHRQTNEGGSIDEEWRHEYIADRVDTFGTAFLGLTVGCARCHDHKSDPVTQRDYYALGSFFAIDEAGLYPYTTGAVPRPAVRLPTVEQATQLARLESEARAAEAVYQAALVSAAAAASTAASTTDHGSIAAPEPIAHFPFGATLAGSCRDERSARVANVPPEVRMVIDAGPAAIECDGDARITVPDLPAFSRADAFSVRLGLWCPDPKNRAVLLHTSHYTEDADAQGYQLLWKEGRLCWEIVHHWPGSAIAIRAAAALPRQKQCDVIATYDGSSRAAGLSLFLDGERLVTDIVRDGLDGPATVRLLELGGRDRDNGFAGGRLATFSLFDRCLSDAECAVLCGRQPTPAARVAHAAAMAADVRAAAEALRQARQALHRHLEAIPELMVMAPHPWPPPRFVLRRGAYDQPDRQSPVAADVPAAVLPFDPAWPRDRLGLAHWLNDAENPLAARVVVDRLWALCFGRGLVATPENFGVLGEPPAQRALLDALAVDFQAQRSTRALLRRIVTSSTFRQSSVATAAEREADPTNERFARGPSFRLSAEVLRDQALLASGLLHRAVGGPSVRPWQPPGLWRDAGVGWGGADYQPDTGPNAHRRSLYTFRKRTAPPPNMAAFDAGSREVCVARRQPTDTPLQALVLLSDPVFTECAAALARLAVSMVPVASIASNAPNAPTAPNAPNAPTAPKATAAPPASSENVLTSACIDERLRFVFVSLAARLPRAAELAAMRTLYEVGQGPEQALTLVASTVMASDAAVVLR